MEIRCPRHILRLNHHNALSLEAILCSHYPLWCTQLTLKAPSPSMTSSTLTGSIKASFSFLIQSGLTGRLNWALKLRDPIIGWSRPPGPSSHAQQRRPGTKKPKAWVHICTQLSSLKIFAKRKAKFSDFNCGCFPGHQCFDKVLFSSHKISI